MPKRVNYKGYELKQEENGEWVGQWNELVTVGHKTLLGLKRKFTKLIDDAHESMLIHHSKGGYDRRGGSPGWKHFGD